MPTKAEAQSTTLVSAARKAALPEEGPCPLASCVSGFAGRNAVSGRDDWLTLSRLPDPVRSKQSRFMGEPRKILDLWASLDVRRLAAFEAVARTGSISRAAKELGYTQPAVSHQIVTLERLTGSRLFDRGSGRGQATLTPAGHLFATHVEALESRLASAHADLQALQDGATHTLRVGAFQSVSARILPSLVQELRANDGSPPIELTETSEET